MEDGKTPVFSPLPFAISHQAALFNGLLKLIALSRAPPDTNDYDRPVRGRSAYRSPSDVVCIVLLQLVLLAAIGAASCRQAEVPAGDPAPSTIAKTPAAPSSAAAVSSAVKTAASYDLAADEAVGGHTLKRHVGRTFAQLAERLYRERQISAASTYPDAATASRVVAAALAANRDRVDAWVARSGSRPNLVLLYRDPGPAPIGLSLSRGDRTTRPCSSARVVMRWLERDHRGIVLTSYPETK